MVWEEHSVFKGISRGSDHQLDGLQLSLSLVKDEEALQTAGVEQQVRAITEVAQELKSFLERPAAEQQGKAVAHLIHALKSGDKDDRELEGIVGRLDSARDELVLRISVAQVSLVGNLKDGFRVAFDVLRQHHAWPGTHHDEQCWR